MATQEKITKAYKEYRLENGTKPASIFQFSKKLKINESEFYDCFMSFEDIDAQIWTDFFKETVAKLHQDETYPTYASREKLLAFYYTWIETLKNNRSYILLFSDELRHPRTPEILKGFQHEFEKFIADLLAEGRESKEVAPRRFIETRYPDAFWLQTRWLLDFWLKDRSKGFEKTDSAVEKAVNTAFDLLGSSALDSMLDLAKFVFQNRSAR